MRLLVAVTSILCLSFVRADTPDEEVPIEKPPIINPEIPLSQRVSRNDNNIVIIDDPPPPPPPPPPPRPFPAVDSNSILDTISSEQLGVDAENFDKFLNDVIERVKVEKMEEDAKRTTNSLPDMTEIGTTNNNIENGFQSDSLNSILNEAQLQFEQFSQAQFENSVNQNKPDPILENLGPRSEQSISNTPSVPNDLNTGPINGPITAFPDLSTNDNFESDDAKRLVQLIEERRELLRQLREQDQIVSNARSAPFRTTQRLSDDFDDFGILRESIRPGMTPLVGNSIGVPVNIVTDSESQRNNRQTDLLADAGLVNAPATIRQRFRDADAGNPNVPSGVSGFGTGQVLSPDSFDNNFGLSSDDDDDFIQRRNALLAQRQLLQEQLARVSGQTLPTLNTALPLSVTSNLNSVLSPGSIRIEDLDDNFQTTGVNLNRGGDDFEPPGSRSQQTSLRNIPGVFPPDFGLANVLASRNRNSFSPSPIPTLRRPQQQDILSGFSDNSVFRSPNSRVPSRDFLLRQFQRGSNVLALSSDLDDGSAIRGTNLPRFPSPLSSIRQGSGIDLLQQTRNNFGIPGVSAPWRPSDDDEPMVQTRGSQFRGFASSLNNLRPSREIPGFQNIPQRVPGVLSSWDNDRSNVLNRNRNNPFSIPGILPSFGVSASDDDSSPVDGRGNMPGFSGFSSSLNNIRRPGVLSQGSLQGLPLTDDDSSSGDVRSNIRGTSGFSTSLNNIRPAGFVNPAASLRSPWTGPLRALDRPPIPLPPSNILDDDDDSSTIQNLQTDGGRISQRAGDFPEFNRQVEQLLQGASGIASFSRGSFNDDDNFQSPFSRGRFFPNFRNVNTFQSFRQPRGSFLLRQRGIF